MEVKVGVHTTPRPKERAGKERQHARVKSKGVRRLDEVCDELMSLGLNSAQIKGVLDGVSRYVARSLKEGFHVEVDGLGIFSLSLSTEMTAKKTGSEVPQIMVDGVNFKCSKRLKSRVADVKLTVVKESGLSLTVTERRQRMLNFLHQQGSISRAKYAQLNGCSTYQADKDIRLFVQEGVVVASGLKTHKVYLLAAE